MQKCDVEDCEKDLFRRQWCNMHYTRWMRHGSLEKPQKIHIPKPCLVDTCELPSKCRGWCNKHYQRWWIYGDPCATEGRDRTPEERFWAQVEKTETCWLWTGARIADGYGVFWLNGKNVRAHRFAYELLVRPIPEGLVLDHVVRLGCRWRHCVFPGHLEPVTDRINILRGSSPLAVAWRHRHGGDPDDGRAAAST